jgi:hypothetical protein
MMKTLLKKLNWALTRKSTEQGLMDYCKLEYASGEVTYAFNNIVAEHKSRYFGSSNV